MPRALPVTFDVRVDLDLGSFLLRRRTAVAVDPADLLPAADPWSLRGLTALDADLANRGYLPTVELRAALARLAPLRLAELGGALLARIDHLLGTDREHTPLFRRFPDAVPEVAQLHHSRRMRAFLRSQPHQPCARCGRRGAEVGIGLLAPCAHLLCPDCLDAQDGPPHCPSCGTALAVHPFLFGGKRKAVREQAPPRKGDKEPREPRGSVLRPLRLLNEDETTAALAELTGLLTRRTALNPQDRDDLATLLAHAPADLAALLPAEIPVRETKALALAELLRREGASALPVLAERLTTATDVLRLLWAHSGAEPDLLPATARRLRLRNLPRPLRRGLLGVLDALPAASLAEDLRRHREPWLRVGELLHPFEHARRFPSAAAAFALLRGTDLDAATAVPGLAEPPAPLRVERVRGRRRLAHTGFAARVESLLAVGDAPGALAELAHRPGELVRRLHHLLRVHEIMEPGAPPPAALSAALARALPAVGPGPLLGAYGRLRGPRTAGERRLYFPRGLVSLAYGREDHGTVVPARSSAPVVAAIEAELLRRSAATLPEPPEVALLDEALTGLAVPFAERSASRALVSVPRGSTLPLPPGDRLRLFLHWVQPDQQRVDLDLSVALYDAGWNSRGRCDYTQLTFGRRAAVHSGDYVSAPPPKGASEFVDLDFAALEAAGARYAVMVVFSYNDVPFDRLPEAFTGFAGLDDARPGGSPLSARAVRQRMDLTGDAKVSVPLIVDLAERRFTWTDLNTTATSGYHSVARHGDTIAALCGDVLDHFAPDRRATLWDVACARAAHATGEVLVRGLDGAVRRWRREPAEPVGGFAERLRLRHAPDGPPVTVPLPELLAGRRAFLALLDADLPVPPGLHGELYRLHPGPLDAAPDALRRLAAGDLVATLAPAP
ncbi:MXAN_6230/SCO0854 family RING domain-containing protein [Kitasatospora sp. NRRL B-11411]|uniref:MXAN_6230/SCO0854 family RING domain-containing protein n=1 Tax=Kitasatospora sp. NRRL B-11411 TaxID=1463822 RepID=UPI0007C58F1B|nr:MXAN_6230/SCO0854 family RING domain-containing protein [Kitasatospora sp. NRRL B-11411]